MKDKNVRFGDLFQFQKKSGVKAGEGLKIGSYPFYTSSESQTKFINEYKFEKPGLIFGTGGNASVHYCEGKFSASADCLVAFPINGQVNAKFVFNFLKGNMQLLEAGFKGAGLKHISKDYISNMYVPVIGLPQQKAINQILDKADSLCLTDKRLFSKYDDLLQSIFHEMFGNLVKNDKGWQIKKVEDVSESRLGKMLDAKKISGKLLGKYLGNSNVLWHEFNLDDLKEMDFSDEDRMTFSLTDGDILMCEGGEVGRCAIWRNDIQDVYFQKALHRIRVENKVINPEYFVWLMYSYAKNNGLKDYVSSVTIQHLTGVKLKSIKIPIPPIKLQDRFADISQNIKQQKNLVKQQILQSEMLFEGLLQRAFKGKLVKGFKL